MFAMVELYSPNIDEAMLVGSRAYDTLDALREHFWSAWRALILHYGNNSII